MTSTKRSIQDVFFPVSSDPVFRELLEAFEGWEDGYKLSKRENISADTVGTIVDYLFKLNFADKDTIFHQAREGAMLKSSRFGDNSIDEFNRLILEVRGTDIRSIYACCKLSHFQSFLFGKKDEVVRYPDNHTCMGIRVMVKRAYDNLPNVEDVEYVVFDSDSGKICGYVDVVTQDALCEIKTNKFEDIKIFDFYQLCGYYFSTGDKNLLQKPYLVVYNPRLNRGYRCKTSDFNRVVDRFISRYGLFFPLPPGIRGLSKYEDFEFKKMKYRQLLREAYTKRRIEQTELDKKVAFIAMSVFAIIVVIIFLISLFR